jgi:putative transcriptional regulator
MTEDMMIDLDKILNIRQAKVKPQKGMVLISNPFLSDYFFRRSVVLLIDHGSDGSFGVIVNKPLNIHINEVTSSFPMAKSGVYLGGPVKTDGIFYMHTLGSAIPGSEEVMEGVYWGGNLQMMEQFIESNPDQAMDRIRFFVGYSGWVTDQLQEELINKSWIVEHATPEEVIGNRVSSLWHDKVKALGKPFEPWLNFPPDPSFN